MYNKSQIKTRNVIERWFGALKLHFPLLSPGIRLSLNPAMTVIAACIGLHNFCQHLKDASDFDDLVIPSDKETNIAEGFSKNRIILIN